MASYLLGSDSALHLAALVGDSAAIDRLPTRAGQYRYDFVNDPLVLRPHIDTRTSDGASALHITAVFDHTAATAKLLEKGADAMAKDKYGSTPLILACGSGHAATASILLKAPSVDAEAFNLLESNALNTSAFNGQLGCVKLLLAHGVDASLASPKTKTTALHCAAYTGRFEVVKLLLIHGVKDCKDANGFTARALAELKDHSEIVALLTIDAKSFISEDSEHDDGATNSPSSSVGSAPKGLLGDMRRPMKAGASQQCASTA